MKYAKPQLVEHSAIALIQDQTGKVGDENEINQNLLTASAYQADE
jgi:hypothetical protein